MKTVLAVIGVVLLVIIVLPFVLIALAYWGSLALLRHIFKKLRHDPEVKFESLIAIPVVDQDLNDEVILKNAQEYFEKLTAEIAKQGDATAGAVRTHVDKKFIDDNRKITSVRSVESKGVKIDFDLSLVQHQDRDGLITTETIEGGDDFALAGAIRAKIRLEGHSVPVNLELVIDYDHEAAIFCIALLSGAFRFNDSTGQLWVHVKSEDVWMVKTSRSPKYWFTYREEYGEKKARMYWFDT